MFSVVIISAAFMATAAIAIPAGPPPPHYEARPYGYEYAVHDEYSGANFGQHEASDGKVVTGTYTVALPDGRTQIVDYTADQHGYGGYIADVKYEGIAHPAPVHKPAPYHPAPIHPKPLHG